MRPCIVSFRPARNCALALTALLLSPAALPTRLLAQPAAPGTSRTAEAPVYRTFFIGSLTQDHFNDIQTDLRNMLPNARIYGVRSERAISVQASPEDMALAEKILADLHHARTAYRLVYTIGAGDAQKRVDVVLADGSWAAVKQGTQVPILIGPATEGSGQQSNVQYKDVGFQLEAALNANSQGIQLQTKIEESSVSEERSGIGTQDPIFGQTSLHSDVTLTLGKPMILGSLNIPGANVRQQIEVQAEPISAP